MSKTSYVVIKENSTYYVYKENWPTPVALFNTKEEAIDYIKSIKGFIVRHFITQSTQGLWQVFNSKNELQDSFASKDLAENYIKWLEEQIDQEENALAWSTNFFIIEDKHRKSFLIKRISDKKEMDYCDTLEIAERRVLDYEGQIRRNEGEVLEEFKERFLIDEQFLIRTKASLTWTGGNWQCCMPKGKWSLIFGIGSTPHEAVERCKEILINARNELNRVITG